MSDLQEDKAPGQFDPKSESHHGGPSEASSRAAHTQIVWLRLSRSFLSVATNAHTRSDPTIHCFEQK